MKVRMNVSITGTRNGVDWPKAGGVIDIPANEAVDMLNAGLAVAVKDAPVVESATVEPVAERTTVPAKRSRKAKA